MLINGVGLGLDYWPGVSATEFAFLCASAGMCAALFVFLQRYTRLSVDSQSRIVSIAHVVISVTISTISLLEMREHLFTPTGFMWLGAPTYSRRMLAVTCGFMYFDGLLLFSLWRLEKTLDAGMVAHHALVLFLYGMGLCTSFAVPYQVACLMNEASTPFLTIHFAVRPSGVWRTLNGACLWLSYLLCRVVFNAVMAYSMACTLTPEIWRAEGLQTLLQLTAFAGLQCLNAVWFFSITKGLVKAILAMNAPAVEGSAGKTNEKSD